MKERSRNLLIANLLALIVFAGFATWAALKLDWRMVGHNLAGASFPQLMGMGVAWLAALFIRPVRLMILIRAMAPEVERRYWPVWSADLIAMAMNSLIPLRAGDMAMALVLRQGLGLRTARGFSAMMVDRFFDLLTVVALFVSALSVAPSVAPWAANLTTTLPIGLVLLAIFLWLVIRFRKPFLSVVDRLLANVGQARGRRWSERFHDLFDGLAVVMRPGLIVPLLGLSVVLWGATAVSYWFGATSVWPTTPVAAGAFVAGAVALGFVIPSPPAAVGVFHAITVLALSMFNVPAESALACAIICHAFQLGSVLILAAFALLTQGVSVRSLSERSDTPQD